MYSNIHSIEVKKVAGEVKNTFDRVVKKASSIVFAYPDAPLTISIDQSVDRQYPNFRPLLMARIAELFEEEEEFDRASGILSPYHGGKSSFSGNA